MIVLGADTDKRSHTVAAVCAATGEVLGEKTVAVGAGGFGGLVVWARGLQGERVWALEDCRHVSGSFERFLLARGERIVRVPTKLMAEARKGGRQRESPTASTRSRSPGRPWERALAHCPPRGWTGPSSTCGCWSITASAWSASGWGSTTRCSGICTISGPSSSCRAAR
jgi:hypothetical protein